MNKNTLLKVIGVVAPLVVAAAGLFYGDIEPTIRSICDAALPGDSGLRTVRVKSDGKAEVTVIMPSRPVEDAGAR